MDGAELRQRRKALGLSQAEFGERLGLARDFIGMMERGVKPVAPRTALAVDRLSPRRAEAPLRTTDPMERVIEQALLDAGIPYVTEGDRPPHPAMAARLDFYLPEQDVFIEVKRLHSDRIAAQMARVPNVIVAQGEAAVTVLAQAIRLLGPGAFATA